MNTIETATQDNALDLVFNKSSSGVINKRIKRYIHLALGYIERKYDSGKRENTQRFCEDAIMHIKVRNSISKDDEDIVKKNISSILGYAENTCSELDEFTLSQSGICSSCGEVILYGQDGMIDYGKDNFCCTFCYLKIEKDNEKKNFAFSKLSEYGKSRLNQYKK